MIIGLILLYSKQPLTIKEYGNVLGYIAAMTAVVFGTVSKQMIVDAMVCIQSTAAEQAVESWQIVSSKSGHFSDSFKKKWAMLYTDIFNK